MKKEELITMSQKEIKRLDMIVKVKEKRCSQKEAAKRLGITPRHMRRLCQQHRLLGPVGVASRRRGQRSNRAYSSCFKQKVLSLVSEHYPDFGPTLACEKLQEQHGLSLSRETLRQWMMRSEQWKSKKQRSARIHPQRPRRAQYGELIQIDGSPHDWFEGRAEPCCLLVFIDDATSRLQALHFLPTETTRGYLTLLRQYMEQHGLPVALYSDKNSIFRVNQQEAQTGTGETQFGRVVRELGIELICANTPQAKGRVEKANRTLQDRLVKELRLKGISDLETANAFLPEFIDLYNQKFAQEPACDTNAHRSTIPPKEVLDLMLTHQETRTCSKNLEVSYQNTVYQIQVKKPSYALRNAKILVCDDLKGRVELIYKDRLLPYKILDRSYRRAPVIPSKNLEAVVSKAKHRPANNHPWRQYERVARKQQLKQQKALVEGGT